MNHPTDKHKEQAQEIVVQCREASEWPGLVWSAQNLSDEPRWLAAWQELESRIASNLAARDAEIKQVLEGLRGQFGAVNCWCDVVEDDTPHLPACLAARTLWDKPKGRTYELHIQDL